jgi:hypothetical protein
MPLRREELRRDVERGPVVAEDLLDLLQRFEVPGERGRAEVVDPLVLAPVREQVVERSDALGEVLLDQGKEVVRPLDLQEVAVLDDVPGST